MAITTKTTECGLEHRCDECNAFCRTNQTIRHARRCESQSQPEFVAIAKPVAVAATVSTATIVAAAKRGEISAVLSDDAIVDAVKLGVVTVSDAMNRDF